MELLDGEFFYRRSVLSVAACFAHPILLESQLAQNAILEEPPLGTLRAAAPPSTLQVAGGGRGGPEDANHH